MINLLLGVLLVALLFAWYDLKQTSSKDTSDCDHQPFPH